MMEVMDDYSRMLKEVMERSNADTKVKTFSRVNRSTMLTDVCTLAMQSETGKAI